MSEEQPITPPTTSEPAVATAADSTNEPGHPVSQPPFPFSEGEEVQLADGTTGKVVGITTSDSGEVSYTIAVAGRKQLAEGELRKIA